MWREKLFALQIHAYNEVEIDDVKRSYVKFLFLVLMKIFING